MPTPPTGTRTPGVNDQGAGPSIGPFARLVDDAALFPPGSAAMPDALSGHIGYRGTWFADLVGPMHCPAARVGELLAEHDDAGWLRSDQAGIGSLHLVLVGDVETLAKAGRAVVGDRRVVLRGVAVTLPGGGDLRSEIATTVPALAAIVDELGDVERGAWPVRCSVEVPRAVAGWLDGLGLLAARSAAFAGPHGSLMAKLRTGGVQGKAFPSDAELAAFICRCVAEQLPFTCKGGLNHAVRHRDGRSGFEHHGFLNVLAGTGLAIDGATMADVAEVIAERNDHAVAETVVELDNRPGGLAEVRRRFVSFASCSVTEPLADLDGLGLL